MLRILILSLCVLAAGIGPDPVIAARAAVETAAAQDEAPSQPAAPSGRRAAPRPERRGEPNVFVEVRDFVIERTGEGGWVTWIQIFVVVFLALLFDLVQRLILSGLKKRLARTKTVWDDAVLDALTGPISLLIWVVGIALAATFVHLEARFVDDAIILSIIGSAAWFFVRLIKNAQANILERSRTAEDAEDRWDPTTVEAIGKLLRLSILITAALIGLQHVGVNISAVVAFGGIGGLAIGFAAKDLLANFFGGLMLYLDRPFVVGEWIRSPDRSIEGTVEHIGWRLTRIRTFDKRPLYVPNSIFTTIAIENPQRMHNRRIYETIGIRYDDVSKMGAITRDVEAMLREHPEIDTDRLLMVYFNAFGPSSLDFFVYTFTRTTNWKKFHEIKHDVLIRISDIITGHGAEIAYPTSTLHVASMPAVPPGAES